MLNLLSQSDDIGRIVLIYVVQLIFSFIFLFLAYRILHRNRNRVTLTLSGFYISEGVGFIFGAMYLPLRINPIVYILYFCAIYLVVIGQIYLVLFVLNLLKIDFKLKNQAMILGIYAIAVFIILTIPGGITINENTNWIPIWSFQLLIIIYIFTTCVIVLPFLFLFFKLYRSFEDKDLKKKLKYFFVGFCGVATTFYGGSLYNSWINPLFNQIWNYLLLFILIPSALLIYYAWGHKI